MESEKLLIDYTKQKRIDTGRLVLDPGTRVDENLLCGICYDIAFKPEECKECESIFCKDCLIKRQYTSLSCPRYKCSKVLCLQNPHKVVKNALLNLKYRCANFNYGCNEVMTLEFLGKHEFSCVFKPVKCIFEGCPELVAKNNIQQHTMLCSYQIRKCEKCQFPIDNNDLKNHDCIKTLYKFYQELKLKHKKYILDSEELYVQLVNRVNDLENATKNISTGRPLNLTLCKEGHKLDWIIASDTHSEFCALCNKQIDHFKFACKSCEISYCTSCRLSLLNSKACPQGHLYSRVRFTDKRHCDICEITPKSNEYWHDSECEFDICVLCKEGLGKGLL